MNNHFEADRHESLLTMEEIENLSMSEGLNLFKRHINPHVGKMYSMLGLSTKKPITAKGMYINMEDGSSVLDFSSGITVCNCGHNHPNIVKARREWASKNNLEHWKFIPSPYQAGLAYNLSKIFPGDLNKVFYSNSGAEANEGAIKMAQMYSGNKRLGIAYCDISFHGKTLGMLSVSGSEKENNKNFTTLPNCHEIKYGDYSALESLIEMKKSFGKKSDIGVFIVEAVRSEGVIIPDPKYLKKVRAICDKYDVVLIVDEVFCGFGRTGKFFAFEHSGIIPDIVTFSKAFGAGKASFGGFISRDPVYKKAYGTLSKSTLHSTTYNGLGEEIVTALETLNVLLSENLVENSKNMGKYFLAKLEELKKRHSNIIKDVRGIGLLLNIELYQVESGLFQNIAKTVPVDVFAKITTGGIISELYEEHNILVYAPLHHDNVIMITPPLIIEEKHIDQFVDSLDVVLKQRLLDKGAKFLKRYMAG